MRTALALFEDHHVPFHLSTVTGGFGASSGGPLTLEDDDAEDDDDDAEAGALIANKCERPIHLPTYQNFLVDLLICEARHDM